MSKTTKIRRLNRKVVWLSEEISVLKWRNINLMRELTPLPFKQYTQPPEFRSSNYNEQKLYNELIEYIYKKMDQLYNDAIERDPYVNVSTIKFTLYIDRNLVYRLSGICGYGDFERCSDGYTFRGQKLVQVLEENHINFVRTA